MSDRKSLPTSQEEFSDKAETPKPSAQVIEEQKAAEERGKAKMRVNCNKHNRGGVQPK